MLAALLLAACQAPPELATNRPAATHREKAMQGPEITSETEEGFQDLVFAVKAHVRHPDGTRLITASGQANGEAVEFAVQLASAWKGGAIKSVDFPTFQGLVILRSTGEASDRLVKVMDALYETKLAPAGMLTATEFTGISLQGNPSALEAGPVKIKLFFESKDEERYAELYLNVDLKASRVELHEKDPEYRKPVIRALSQVTTKGDAVRQ
jgi:hypothetical protein